MVLLFSLLIASLLVFPGNHWIQKHTKMAYCMACIFSGMVVTAVWSGWNATLTGLSSILASVLTQGGLAGALFIYVMYASAVPSVFLLKKRVIVIRRQLSIIACILTLGHNIAFGRQYFVLLFTKAADMRLTILLASICSVLMILIMLPLFITSFLAVRKRMKPKAWKQLQRIAYAFYTLLYIHIMLLNMPNALHGKWSSMLNVVLYSIVYLTYFSSRIVRAMEKKQKNTMMVRLVFGIIFVILLFVLAGIEQPATTQTSVKPQTDVKPIVASLPRDDIADGEYTGTATGYNGKLTVLVTIEEGSIKDAVLCESADDEPYLTDSADVVLTAIVQNNSTDVDTVSGATTTSDAIIKAVKKAIVKAEQAYKKQQK